MTAEHLAALASALLLMTGLALCAVGHRWTVRGSRAALGYAPFSFVLAGFARESPWPDTVTLAAVTALVMFFAAAVTAQVVADLSGRARLIDGCMTLFRGAVTVGGLVLVLGYLTTVVGPAREMIGMLT